MPFQSSLFRISFVIANLFILCFGELDIPEKTRLLTAAINAVPLKLSFNSSDFIELEQHIDPIKNATTYCFKEEALSKRYSHLVIHKRGTEEKGKMWVIISQVNHKLYYREWENQTFVILRKTNNGNNTYSILKLYLWERSGKFVQEWDTWKPPFTPYYGCQCNAVQMLFRPCNEEYCTLPQSGLQQYEKTIEEMNMTFSGFCANKNSFINGPSISERIPHINSSMKGKNSSENKFKTNLRIPPGCVYTFGQFYRDIMDDDETAKLIGQTILNSTSGQAKSGVIKYPFVGLGNCPIEELPNMSQNTENKLQYSEMNVSKIVDYYLSTMKSQCLGDTVKKDLLEAFRINLIRHAEYKGRFVIRPNISHSLFGQRLINSHQENLLETTFFIAAYSQVYQLLSKSKLDDVSPDHPFTILKSLNISENSRMITQVILWMYDVAQKALPLHVIKMTRKMVYHLKSNFIVLLKENANLKNVCPRPYLENECSFQVQDNLQNRIHIMTLMQFIVFGTNPKIDPEDDTFTRFLAFRLKYFKYNKQLVANYDPTSINDE